METCKICQQECNQDQEYCGNCGYPLTTFPSTLGEIPQPFQEILSQRERWEKYIWQKYEQLQQQYQELSRDRKQLQQKFDQQQQENNNNQQLQQQIRQLQQEITNLWQENARLHQKLESQNQSQQQVELRSAVGYDYTRLQDLLANHKWQEADRETANAMLKVAGREKQGWLDVEDVDNFPCEDLQTIDRLWVEFSNGKFGLSVQKEIYQNLGGTRKFDLSIWGKFGDTIGWRNRGKWKLYSEMNWENPMDSDTPRGHLPAAKTRPAGVLPTTGSHLGKQPANYCSLLSRQDL
jgi:hypothetical protein